MKLVPNRLHYISIAALALTMIAVQILLSRIFSVVFYYHFAFAGVTFAMLGLTIGALRVYTLPKRFLPERVDVECAHHSVLAGLLLTASVLLLVDLPGRLMGLVETHGSIKELLVVLFGLSCLLGIAGFIKAFVDIGVAVTLLLTYFPAHTSRLYAVDLASAALGCLLVILALKFLDPISLLLLLSTILAFLAWYLLKPQGNSRRLSLTRAAALLLCALLAVQSVSYVSGSPLFRVRIGKFIALDNLIFERWNTYSHVAVFPAPIKKPDGWGFGSTLDIAKYPNTEQYKLKIDADASTVLTKFDGDTSKVGYLKYDITNLGYHLRKIGHTAVIGVGGGRDVLSAITFGAEKVTGIEINPAIFEALNKRFYEYTGKLSSYPNVQLVNAEARSYISSSPATYDMVQISLIDTWAATAAGGLALSENKLYTTEAWTEFLTRLSDNGMLAVSRWFVPGQHQGELYRMLSIAAETLRTINPAANIRDHVLAANSNHIVTVVVSKSPFTSQEIANFIKTCQQYGFKPLLSPQQSFDAISDTIMSGNANSAFYASHSLDYSAPTDDRPFFFNMARFSQVLFQPSSGNYNLINNMAVYVLFFLTAATTVAMGYCVLRPFFKQFRERQLQWSACSPYITYFMCIGLGFMFIEMALMQRLMIFLGHPVYGLSVILFTMLLFSGIGSYTVKDTSPSARSFIQRPALLCLLLVATGFAIPPVMASMAHYDTLTRIAASVVLLAPISFFMGMMFPLGVGAASRNNADLLPWLWALNGVASVFASIFAVVVSMSYGISFAYVVGAACYMICAVICMRWRNSAI